MVDEAIEFIRTHEPEGGYLLADSFGKDSTVILELSRMAGVKFLHIHNRTGIEPPELIKFGHRTRPNVIDIAPRTTLWQGIKKWGAPTINQRWCCPEMKERHVAGHPRNVLVGIRAEESFKRKQRPRISQTATHPKKLFKPIFHWLEWHVWEFIEGMNLPYCELYDEGFSRLGCVVCPMICSSGMGQVKRNRERWPGFYRTFEHAVTWWFWNVTWWDRVKWRQPERFLGAWYRAFHDGSK
jgi:phosphoadenosine phosphosulfate reductase